MDIKRSYRKIRLARKIAKTNRKNRQVTNMSGYKYSGIRLLFRKYRLASRIHKFRLQVEQNKEYGNLEDFIENIDLINAKQDKKLKKRQRRYIRKYYTKNIIDILTFRYSFEKDSHGYFNKKEGINIIFYGVTYFIFSYMFVYGIYEFSKILAGLLNDMTMRMYYYGTFAIADANEWTSYKVKMIYSIGPVIAFFISVFSWLLLKYVITEQGKARLFLLYTILLGFSFSIGEAAFSTFMQGGLSYYYEWTYLGNGIKVLIFILAILTLIMIGKMIKLHMLAIATSFTALLPNKAFKAYFRYQYFLPLFIGAIIIYLFKFPGVRFFEITEVFISIFVVILSAYLSLKEEKTVIGANNEPVITRPWLLLSGAIILLVMLRYFFDKGIDF